MDSHMEPNYCLRLRELVMADMKNIIESSKESSSEMKDQFTS